jgi:hypothetical protein
MTSLLPNDEGQSLCRQCGLCCDGSLFARVILGAGDDASQVEAAGITVVEHAGGRQFPQPCQCFRDGACSVYDTRPGPCRRFRCQLLVDVQEGRISSADGAAIVGRAVSWRDELLRRLGVPRGARQETLNQLMRSFEARRPDEALLIGGVRALLGKYFRRAGRA